MHRRYLNLDMKTAIQFSLNCAEEFTLLMEDYRGPLLAGSF